MVRLISVENLRDRVKLRSLMVIRSEIRQQFLKFSESHFQAIKRLIFETIRIARKWILQFDGISNSLHVGVSTHPLTSVSIGSYLLLHKSGVHVCASSTFYSLYQGS